MNTVIYKTKVFNSKDAEVESLIDTWLNGDSLAKSIVGYTCSGDLIVITVTMYESAKAKEARP